MELDWESRDGPTQVVGNEARKLKRTGSRTIFYTTGAPRGTGRMSTDAGETWTVLEPPSGYAGCIDFVSVAGIGWGLFFDEANTKTAVGKGGADGSGMSISHAIEDSAIGYNIAAYDASRVAAIYSSGGSYYLLYTLNGGGEWKEKILIQPEGVSVSTYPDTPLLQWLGPTRIVTTIPGGPATCMDLDVYTFEDNRFDPDSDMDPVVYNHNAAETPAGDLLLILALSQNDDGTVVPTIGGDLTWTLIHTQPYFFDTMSLRTWWAVLPVALAENFQVEITGLETLNLSEMSIWGFEGMNLETPIAQAKGAAAIGDDLLVGMDPLESAENITLAVIAADYANPIRIAEEDEWCLIGEGMSHIKYDAIYPNAWVKRAGVNPTFQADGTSGSDAGAIALELRVAGE